MQGWQAQEYNALQAWRESAAGGGSSLRFGAYPRAYAVLSLWQGKSTFDEGNVARSAVEDEKVHVFPKWSSFVFNS
jgi:hypothetical protein